MVYAYDLWAQLPVKDIYDTQMMLAHVSQLKDMYEKAAQDMKDFKKEYGDFYSSRPEDMDWYRKEYGKIKDKMDQLYAQGLDLRSPEFRTAMARARDSFDIAGYNERKKSAANYDIYLLNKAKLDAAGKYNPQMEDAIIRSLGLNNPNKIWDRLSPSIYQDPIEITDNIFDKMEDDFIGTDKNGMDWYGVSRERRKQALDSAIDDILNTPSGKFHYDQYKAAHPELNEADALEGFKNGLLDMSIKYEHKKAIENPVIKSQREYDKSIKLMNYQHSLNEKAADAALNRSIEKIKANRAGKPGYDANGNPISPESEENKNVGYVGRRQYDAMHNDNSYILDNAYKQLRSGKSTSEVQNGKKYTKYRPNMTQGDILKLAKSYYNKSSVTPGGSDLTATIAFLTNMANVEEIADGNKIKRMPISFDSGDILSRNVAARKVFANELAVRHKLTLNEPKNQEDIIAHLRNNKVQGYLANNNVTVNYTNLNGLDYLGFNFTVRVKKSDYMKSNPYGFNDDVNKRNGITSATVGQKEIIENNETSSNNTRYKNEEYVDIPVTRLYPLYGQNPAMLNSWADKILGGSSYAAKSEQNYIEQILNSLTDE